jgi:aerobic-type carbon monoxide dehydrogenase small subunit (CoxS/CutS family)
LERKIRLKINGIYREIKVPPAKPLLYVLREDLLLTGTKEGCGKGECGACTVLVDGKPVPSCLLIVAQVDGSEITTIEGLSKDGELDPLQESFVEEGAIQCGFCTPGLIISAKALLMKNPSPSEEEIREAISGNLCRCTGYSKVIKAIKGVSG